MRWGALPLVCLSLTGVAHGQTIDIPSGRMPPQVIPAASDPGTPTFSASDDGGSYGSTAGDAGSAGGGGGVTYSGTTTVERADVLASLQQQPYGNTAIATAGRLGVNPNGTAAFASAESNFRNVGTSNGSTSATGPWQITSGTWSDTVARNNLPYTAADRTNPEAQAVVANYIIRQYGGSTSQALDRVATVQETYYSYVYGPSAGARIAGADASMPLTSLVSSTSLANNGMSNWTVGQLQNFTRERLGSSATQPVFAAGS